MEGYLYLLHRVTGLGLLLFLVAHVLLTSSRLLGLEAFGRMLALSASPFVQLFEYPLFVAFAFHACNGVRLILVELGFAVGRAELPVYPYRGSIRRQRPLLLAAMLLAGALLVAGGLGQLRLAH